MALWTNDLTMREVALGAAQQGGLACFFQAGRYALGAAMTGDLLDGTHSQEAIYRAVGGGLEVFLLVVAGLRLLTGRGLIWGGLAVGLVLFELLKKIVAFDILGTGGILLGGLLTIAMINGLRGAWVLRRSGPDPEEAAAIFE